MSKTISPVFIYAASSFITVAEGDILPPLKQLVVEKSGASVRRVGRFIQLALIGTGECLQGQSYEPATAVYLASENGDMETQIDVLNAMYREQQPPKPLSFINTVSNAACFYIGNAFHLSGESSFISAVGLAFERALSVALVDLQLGRVPAALVGVVDICYLPLQQHRIRIGAEPDYSVGEGSTWLWLSPLIEGKEKLAEVRSAGFVHSIDELSEIGSIPGDYSGILVAGAVSVTDQEKIRQRFPRAVYQSDIDQMPFFNSRQAHVVARFLHQNTQGDFLYINQGIDGDMAYLYLRK